MRKIKFELGKVNAKRIREYCTARNKRVFFY